MDCKTLLALAEGALSPCAAYEWLSPMRATWGYWREPDMACLFLGRNPEVKALIWC